MNGDGGEWVGEGVIGVDLGVDMRFEGGWRFGREK